jgi:hypothetical protein
MRPRREGTTLPRQRCPVQACNCLVALPATESLAEYPPCYIFELGPSKRIFRDSNPDLRCVTITLNTRGSIANIDGTPQLVLASRRESKSGRGAKEGRDKRMWVLAQRGRYCTVCRYRNASPRWKEKGWMDVKGQRSWWTAPLLICLVRPPSASRPATLSESSLFLNSFERTERGYNIKRGHSIFQSSFPLPVRPCLPHTTTLPCASFQPFPGRLKGMDNVQIATGWSRVEG